jgi:hypothetical protein
MPIFVPSVAPLFRITYPQVVRVFTPL